MSADILALTHSVNEKSYIERTILRFDFSTHRSSLIAHRLFLSRSSASMFVVLERRPWRALAEAAVFFFERVHGSIG